LLTSIESGVIADLDVIVGFGVLVDVSTAGLTGMGVGEITAAGDMLVDMGEIDVGPAVCSICVDELPVGAQPPRALPSRDRKKNDSNIFYHG
jgi:hypothetical protein